MPAENTHTNDELFDLARLFNYVTDFAADNVSIEQVNVIDAEGAALGVIYFDSDEDGWRYRAY